MGETNGGRVSVLSEEGSTLVELEEIETGCICGCVGFARVVAHRLAMIMPLQIERAARWKRHCSGAARGEGPRPSSQPVVTCANDLRAMHVRFTAFGSAER